MKHSIKQGIVICAIFLSSIAGAADFKEGIHYDTFQNSSKTASPTFIEYVSFFCPACNNLNSLQDEIYRSVPSGVIKRRVSVDMIRKTTSDGFLALSKAMAVNDELYKTIGNSLVDLIFLAVHEEGAQITPSLVEKIVKSVDRKYDAEVLELYNKPKIEEIAKFTLKNQRVMASRGMLRTVPRIIINGRHVVKFDGLDKKAFFKELHELTKFLVRKDYGNE